MTKARTRVKHLLRHAGVEISSHRWTVHSRRRLLLSDVDVLLDVGANVGQYAREVRTSGWSGRIVSYEPVPEAFTQLAAAAEGDREWTAARVAVGDTAGTLDLLVSEEDVFTSALTTLPRGKEVYGGMNTVRTVSAPLERLDDLAAEYLDAGERIGVKVDVQGYERAVLDGAERVLSAARFWEMELTPVPLYDGQMLMVEALARLNAAGLDPVAIENIFSDSATGRSLQFNGLFLRE